MASDTKGQHYIPRFYLEHFTDNGRLCVYDRARKLFFTSTPEKICKKRMLYETMADDNEYILYNQIENKLADLETIWGPVISAVLGRYEAWSHGNKMGLICSAKEKEQIRAFFAYTYFRHPSMIDKLLDYYGDIIRGESDDGLAQSVNELFDLLGYGSAKGMMVHSVKSIPFNSEIENNPVAQLTKDLEDLHMFFLVAQTNEFILSSFPFVILKADSLQYIMPLSPNIAVCWSDNPADRCYRNRFVSIDADNVNEINMSYFLYPKEQCHYLICKDKERIDRLCDQFNQQNSGFDQDQQGDQV